MDLSVILDRAADRSAPSNQLTLSQESELVADIKLLFMTWLVLVRTPYEDIVRDYHFNKREALHYLIRLDRLKVIELQPGNRVRLLVSRHFSWRPGGPVQRYIHHKLLHEFFASSLRGCRRNSFSTADGCPMTRWRTSNAHCAQPRENAPKSSSAIHSPLSRAKERRLCWRCGPGISAALRSSIGSRPRVRSHGSDQASAQVEPIRWTTYDYEWERISGHSARVGDGEKVWAGRGAMPRAGRRRRKDADERSACLAVKMSQP